MIVNAFLLFPENDDSILCIGNDPQDFENILYETIKLFSAIAQYKEQNQNIELFYDINNIDTFLQKVEDIFRCDNFGYYLTDPIKQFKFKLQNTRSRNWRDRPQQDKTCYYVLWELAEFQVLPVNGSTLAEICERNLRDTESNIKYLIVDINNRTERKRSFLPVLKDGFHLPDVPEFVRIDFVCDETEFKYWWEHNLGKISFNLHNKQRFIKTKSILQGQSVYQEISTDYYWYLDNLHKDHYEVFNSQGKHIGVADLNGKIDAGKKEDGRKIEVN